MRAIIKISLGVLLMFAITSCNKKLDIQPKQSVDADVALTTPDDVESAVVGAYSIMGTGNLYGTALILDADLQASENYLSWRGTFQAQRQVANKTMTRDNLDALRIWTTGYNAINMANVVLSALNVVTDVDQKARLEGEALFIRGIMHFELVRFYALPWGATAANNHLGIVIRTKATKTETDAFEKAPRNTVAQVYQQIIADLTAAAAKMPEDNGTRADKYTALAFLARVYLQQGDYAKARDAANAVIQSNKYKMNASVRAVFDNKNTDESIWEIQQNDQNNAGAENDGLGTFYASLPGNIGRGDVRINAGWLDTAYNANDLRKQEWYYIGAPTSPRPGNLYSGKWKFPNQNIPIVRIAEMYLIRAETNLRLGTTVGDTPENDLAKIRNTIRTNLPIISNPTLDDVLTERFRELAFEGIRIHDIKRLRQTLIRYDSNGVEVDRFQWNDNRLVFPIPQSDVDASGGIIVQNPGY